LHDRLLDILITLCISSAPENRKPALNLNVTGAAKALGVRRATLSDLMNEKASLSPEMALRIEKVFGVSMEMMLRIQTDWDIATIRRREQEFALPRYDPGQLAQ
jgi:antitoxin HigA-1